MSHDIAAMSMLEFAEAMARKAWLLLPIGTTEEHGPHLPLSSDMIQAEYVCRAVAREVDGVAAPPVAYGVCGTTRNFPGTISIRSCTLEALVREILAGYVDQGARRIAVVSGHAGKAHMEALRQAALPLAEQDDALSILVIGPHDFAPPWLAEAGLAAEDGHAGCLETSVMLAMDPLLVRTDRIPGASPLRFPRFQMLSRPERLFPLGVMGDASQASRALGERVLQYLIGEIVRILLDAAPPAPAKEAGR